jgi:hypothetical protein
MEIQIEKRDRKVTKYERKLEEDYMTFTTGRVGGRKREREREKETE